MQKSEKTSEQFTLADRYLSKVHVADLLGVTPRTVDNFMRRGLIPFAKIGRTVRFRLVDIQQHVDQNFRVCRRRDSAR
ncbi:MAG: helix-turn-helix domain-containing protein [Verrucomicrobiota bacterium]